MRWCKKNITNREMLGWQDYLYRVEYLVETRVDYALAKLTRELYISSFPPKARKRVRDYTKDEQFMVKFVSDSPRTELTREQKIERSKRNWMAVTAAAKKTKGSKP